MENLKPSQHIIANGQKIAKTLLKPDSDPLSQVLIGLDATLQATIAYLDYLHDSGQINKRNIILPKL